MRGESRLVMTIVCAPLMISAACSTADRGEIQSERYAVEVLAHEFGPSVIPDPLAADFDEDGTIDQLTVEAP